MAASNTEEKTVDPDYGPSDVAPKEDLARQLRESKQTIGHYKIQYDGEILTNDKIKEKVSTTLGPKAERLLYGKNTLKKKATREKQIKEKL